MQNLLIYLYINIINNVWVTITKWHQVHYNISDSETKYNINEALLSQVSSKNSIISSLGYTVSLRTLISCCLQKSVLTFFLHQYPLKGNRKNKNASFIAQKYAHYIIIWLKIIYMICLISLKRRILVMLEIWCLPWFNFKYLKFTCRLEVMWKESSI